MSSSGTASPYHHLRVDAVIQETPDTRSFVLSIPEDLVETFRYEAGQFLTFRVSVGSERLVRCYSLASSPATDSAPKFTVKRVADGRVSNRLNDAVEVGSELEVMKPAGIFCLRDRSSKILLFGGGSGITPIISIVKTALATTKRPIRLFYANRDSDSVIFKDELAELERVHGDRLEITHRLDDVDGFADAAVIASHVGGDRDADFYICGPGPYMDVVEEALGQLGVSEDQIFIERFTYPEHTEAPAPPAAGEGVSQVTVTLDGKTIDVQVAEGQSILAAAIAAGLDAPFACEEGYCGCCMATLEEGEVHMVDNKALDEDQLAEGWVLTCQGRPKSARCKIRYPD